MFSFSSSEYFTLSSELTPAKAAINMLAVNAMKNIFFAIPLLPGFILLPLVHVFFKYFFDDKIARPLLLGSNRVHLADYFFRQVKVDVSAFRHAFLNSNIT